MAATREQIDATNAAISEGAEERARELAEHREGNHRHLHPVYPPRRTEREPLPSTHPLQMKAVPFPHPLPDGWAAEVVAEVPEGTLKIKGLQDVVTAVRGHGAACEIIVRDPNGERQIAVRLHLARPRNHTTPGGTVLQQSSRVAYVLWAKARGVYYRHDVEDTAAAASDLLQRWSKDAAASCRAWHREVCQLVEDHVQAAGHHLQKAADMARLAGMKTAADAIAEARRQR